MSQHHFDINLAKEYGIEEAILINNIDFWLHKNLVNSSGIWDDAVWTTFLPKDMINYFPYWNDRKIRRLLVNLTINSNILKTCQFHKTNRVNSYTFTDEFLLKNGARLNIFSYFQNIQPEITNEDFVNMFKNITEYTNPNSKDTRHHGTYNNDKCLTEKEKQLITFIKHWNKKAKDNKSMTVHKISPNPEDYTNTVAKSLQRLNAILEGDYFSTNRFPKDSQFIYDNKITETDVYEAIDNYILILQQEYYPTDKSWLPSDFKDFLFNTYNNTSTLLFILKNGVSKIPTYTPSSEILDKYMSLLPSISQKHKNMVPNKLKAIYRKFEVNKNLSTIYDNYSSIIGTDHRFFTQHINYLKNNYSELTIGHLNTYGKVWDRFKDYLYDNFKISIDLPENRLKILKGKKANILIRSGQANAKDFDENFNYIGGNCEIRN